MQLFGARPKSGGGGVLGGSGGTCGTVSPSYLTSLHGMQAPLPSLLGLCEPLPKSARESCSETPYAGFHL